MDAPWHGWTDNPPPLPENISQLLASWPGTPLVPVPEESVRLPAPALSPAAHRDLAALVGAGWVRDDPADRLRHAGGKSTLDLVRVRAGDASGAPDAVVLPGSADEILAVLRLCAEHGVAVVPFGGGTSVVGGVTPEPGSPTIALDLRRLDRLVSVDRESRLAVLQAGVRAPRAEELLGEQGLTLGHIPQSFEYATIGGFAATRSSGQASGGYGRFDAMVAALTVATPRGLLHSGRAPSSAAGPDLRQLFLGSEGALGVITDVTLRVRPLPEIQRYEGWALGDFLAGLDVLRRLAQQAPAPAIVRLTDAGQLILGYLGTAGEVAAQRAAATGLLDGAGAEPLGTAAGEAWREARFAAPYLRDSLLAAGVFGETLETATWWSGLPELYRAVRAALIDSMGEPALVQCHISHLYETGASLYFTVAGPLDDRAVERWTAAKIAATKAILAAGGTVTHHHGVGRDHRGGYAEELGGTGVDLLRAIKRHLDPTGILNPGVLVP